MICCSVNRLFLISVILQVDGPHFHSTGTAVRGQVIDGMFGGCRLWLTRASGRFCYPIEQRHWVQNRWKSGVKIELKLTVTTPLSCRPIAASQSVAFNIGKRFWFKTADDRALRQIQIDQASRAGYARSCPARLCQAYHWGRGMRVL